MMSSTDFSGNMTYMTISACTQICCFAQYGPFSHIPPQMI